MRSFTTALIAGAAACLMAGAANAAVITLTFEGIADQAPVGDFYAGLGIEFSDATLALIDSDAGGSGNFANEPTADTIMFFVDANNAILNYSAGFETGFSFFYSSSTAASVMVYDGLNGTGNLLATLNLTAQGFDNCAGDPNGDFCNWTAVGVLFGGVARSIDFGGTANQTGFDNITFGSDRPIVPEPAAWALMITGFGLVGAAARRRRTAIAA